MFQKSYLKILNSTNQLIIKITQIKLLTLIKRIKAAYSHNQIKIKIN